MLDLNATSVLTCCEGKGHRLPCPFARGYVRAQELAATLKHVLDIGLPRFARLDEQLARKTLLAWFEQQEM